MNILSKKQERLSEQERIYLKKFQEIVKYLEKRIYNAESSRYKKRELKRIKATTIKQLESITSERELCNFKMINYNNLKTSDKFSVLISSITPSGDNTLIETVLQLFEKDVNNSSRIMSVEEVNRYSTLFKIGILKLREGEGLMIWVKKFTAYSTEVTY